MATGRRIGRWGKSMAKSCVGDRVGTGDRDRCGQGRAVPIYFFTVSKGMPLYNNS